MESRSFQVQLHALDVGVGGPGTVIAPAAGRVLPRHQPHRHRLDQRHIAFAKAIQEHDGQRQGIGVRQLDAGLANAGCRLLDHRIFGRDIAFQQRQGDQGRGADFGCRAGRAGPRARLLQLRNPPVDGGLDRRFVCGRNRRRHPSRDRE